MSSQRRAALLLSMPVTAVTLVLATLAPAGAAVVDPPGTVRITPDAGATLRDRVSVLTGSPRYVVLRVEQRMAWVPAIPLEDSLGEVGAVTRLPPHLVVRAADGELTDLGEEPEFAYRHSLVGDTLSFRSDTETSGRARVAWWDLAAGTHGSELLQAGDVYQTGAPGGFLVSSGDRLVRHSTAGAVTDLGAPFTGTFSVDAVAGDAGVVVTAYGGPQSGRTVYQPFDDPGTFTTLSPAGGLRCPVVVAAYAGCRSFDPDTVVLLPLDGVRDPKVVAVDGGVESLAVAGSTLVWQGTSRTLHSFAYGAPTVAHPTRRFGVGVFSAYGAAVVPDADYSHLLSTTSAPSTPTVLTTSGRSPVAATSVSLSPGRLVYNDDRRIAAPSFSSTFDTEIATSSPAPTVGTTGTVQAGTMPLVAQGSGTTTVVGTTSAYPSTGVATVRRIFRTPRGSTTIPGTSLKDPSSLSGNRFVYLVRTPKNVATARLYDAATGRNTLAQSGFGFAAPTPAVSGDQLAFIRHDGSVWRKNLVTGRSVQLSPPRYFTTGRVFASGDWVGWNLSAGDEEHEVFFTAYRNAKTMAPTQVLTTSIEQLSSAGVVVSAGRRASDTGLYTLLTYAGETVPLVPRVAGAPQVEGRSMAWIDDGVLKVAPVAVPAAAPRFLGDPLAPAALHAAGTAGWHADAPYSAPLTSCSVEVSSGSTVVRTLPCAPARMRVGVASFDWDGTFGGHRARAGDYVYRISAAGAGGAALNTNGDRLPATRTIAVGRPTGTALHVSPTRVPRGRGAVLRAQLTTSLGSSPAARRVRFDRLVGSSWQVVRTVDTAAGGSARLTVSPRGTTRYRAVFAGSFLDRASTSRVVILAIR